jgi:hypothetical protein
MELNPPKDTAVHEGDDPSFQSEFLKFLKNILYIYIIHALLTTNKIFFVYISPSLSWKSSKLSRSITIYFDILNGRHINIIVTMTLHRDRY